MIAGKYTISKTLAKLYTECLSKKRIPTAWKNAKMVIFFRKENKKDLRNYRPIILLSNIYKVFTKVLPKCLEMTLDENLSREQAGFRNRYSTIDHIHVVNQLKEKCREYNIPVRIAFVDYEKVFDSVQTQAVLTSLQEQWVELLKEFYTNSSMIQRKQQARHQERCKIRIYHIT